MLTSVGGALEAEDECGDTPLHFAVREDRVDAVRFLLSKGADPHHENQDGESPSLLAKIVGSNTVKNLFLSINECESDGAMVLDGKAVDVFETSLERIREQHTSTGQKKTTFVDNTHAGPHYSLNLSGVWQGQNSTSYPKRLTPNSNLPGCLGEGHLVNV